MARLAPHLRRKQGPAHKEVQLPTMVLEWYKVTDGNGRSKPPMNATKPALIVFILLLICVGILFTRFYIASSSFRHLEQEAQSAVTATELQSWATSLLNSNPMGTNLTPGNWGTNFPKQLLSLAPQLGPHVIIYQAQAPNPPWIRIAWGSGGLGDSGFEVGPTNFVSLQPGHEWAPGVYFFKR